MAGIFKANDIVRAAEEIETRGEAFYQRLVNATEDAEAREVFEYLKREEASHREIFHEMGKRLEPVQMPAWASEEEYTMYMQSMLDSHALFNLDLETTGDMSREEGIRMAMQFEKDTMLFFHEMKTFVPESEIDHVEKCVEEERKHLKRLTALLKS